jgi:hypothetical protein
MIEAGQVLQRRYTLQQRLGRTAAGHATWLATDNQTDEEVTVKLLVFFWCKMAGVIKCALSPINAPIT